MSKRERITLMLERYHDFVDPACGGRTPEAAATPGARVQVGLHDPGCGLLTRGLACTCWQRSFAELDRCLRLLRADCRQYSHLRGRFFLATRTQRRVWFKGNRWVGLDPNEAVLGHDMAGRPNLARPAAASEHVVIVARWPGWVSLAEVDEALDQLERLYLGEPLLPWDKERAA